jgi:hypothetical protein
MSILFTARSRLRRLADFFSRREEVLVLETDLLDAFSAPFDFSPALDLLLLIGNKKL